ncbi:hypothetical protein ACFSJQ_20815 [Vibrio olivae]
MQYKHYLSLCLTKNQLVEGTKALLVDQKGSIDNLGTAFIGERGLLAVLFDGIGDQNSLLTALADSNLVNQLDESSLLTELGDKKSRSTYWQWSRCFSRCRY